MENRKIALDLLLTGFYVLFLWFPGAPFQFGGVMAFLSILMLGVWVNGKTPRSQK